MISIEELYGKKALGNEAKPQTVSDDNKNQEVISDNKKAVPSDGEIISIEELYSKKTSSATEKEKDVVIPDKEISGATGFETDDLDLKRAINERTVFQKIYDAVDQATELENIARAYDKVSETERVAGEKTFRVGAGATIGLLLTIPEIAEFVINRYDPEIVEDIKKSEFGKGFNSFINKIDPSLELSEAGEQIDEALSSSSAAASQDELEYLQRNIDEQEAEKIATDTLQYMGGYKALQKGGMEIFTLLASKYGQRKARKIAEKIQEKADIPQMRKGPTRGQKIAGEVGGVTGVVFTGTELTTEEQEKVANIIAENPEIFTDSVFENIADVVARHATAGYVEGSDVSNSLVALAKILKENPDDTDAEKQLKRVAFEAGLAIPFQFLPGVILYTAGAYAKAPFQLTGDIVSGARKIAKSEPVNKTAKIVSEKLQPITDPIKTGGKVVIESTGIGTPVKAVTEQVAKINTGAGRFLTSSAALPKELFRLAVERKTGVSAAEFETKVLLKNLRELQQKEGVSDDAFETYFNTGKAEGVSPKFVEEFDKIKTLVNSNEDKINDGLGLTGQGRIGIRADGQDFFVTRSFKVNEDSRFLAEVIDALKGNGKKIVPYLPGRASLYTTAKKDIPSQGIKAGDKVPTGLMRAIENARKEFQKTGMTLEDSNKAILQMVQNVGNKDNASIMANLFSGVTIPSNAAPKVLAKRKELSESVLEILGKETNPYKNLQNTLVNQNKLLTELDYFNGVEKYLKANTGQRVKLPGLVPLLPSKKVSIDGPQGTGYKLSGDYLAKLEDVAAQSIGKFGGDSGSIIKDLYSSAQFANMIRDGIDAFSPLQRSGVMRGISKASSLLQAKETLFDAPAYMLNTAGVVQSLIGNGQFLNPKNYNRAVKAVETLVQQVKKDDPKAVATLAMLKRLGVIDQDVTGAMIEANAKAFSGVMRNGYNEGAYTKTMQAFGRAYGQPDLYGKIVAFEAEKAALMRMFPRKTSQFKTKTEYDEFINQEAASIVRNTMPTYGVAPPIFREFARTPLIGNYILFPTELVRTTKNILKQSVKDITQGSATGNEKQVATGFRRLAGFSAAMMGADFAIDTNNELMSGDDAEIIEKTLNYTGASWNRGGRTAVIEPPVLDETAKEKITLDSVKEQFPRERFNRIKSETGYEGTYNQFIKERLKSQREAFEPYIKVRSARSATFDMFDQIKAAARLLIGKFIGSGVLPEEDIDKAFPSAAGVLANSYISPKAITEAAIAIITRRDPDTGRSIFDEAVGVDDFDRLMNTFDDDSVFMKTVMGGSGKVIRDYIALVGAEDALGKGNALRRASETPITIEDLRTKILTGTGTTTDNLSKRIGWDLSTRLKPIAATATNFKNKLRRLEFKLQTPQDVDNIVAEYVDLQRRKRQGMRDLTKRIDTFKQTPYTRIYRDSDGEVKEERKVLGVGGVLAAASNDFWYTPDEQILIPTVQQLVKATDRKNKDNELIFIPDRPFDDAATYVKSLSRRGFDEKLLNNLTDRLMKAFNKEIDTPLFEDVEVQGEQR